MRCVVQVWFEADNAKREQRPNFELVETDFADFEQFLIALDADELISGSRLLTRRGEGAGERLVFERQPIAFRRAAVVRTTLPSWRIIEEVEE